MANENTKTNKEPIISKENTPEFIGQIIDIFEDFLADKNIEIPNPEKEDDRDSYENPDEEIAILYGSDYGELQTALENTMEHWGILKLE